MKFVNIIGAGLAGCEAAYQLSKRGFGVVLYEQKPKYKSNAHTLDTFAELVCSNSLKSQEISTASGLLKAELELMDCLLLRLAKQCSVPAGSALAVDREQFSQLVTNTIATLTNITIKQGVVEYINTNIPTIIATGPLTSGKLSLQLQELTGGFLDFFDAVSPIIEMDSINMERAFVQDRYNKHANDNEQSKETRGDYINCTIDKQEYDEFFNAIISAERVQPKDWENIQYFENCMPIEVIAKRGYDTMRFGPLRPVGFVDPATNKRPYAVLQLRKENTNGNIYNLVGFQTSLKFGEQKRVFGIIPALKNAEFVRYGVMHRNSFVNAPKVLNNTFALKSHSNIYIAGQLSGLEGYMESIMSGLIAGINMAQFLCHKPTLEFDNTTMMGALTDYITKPNSNYTPMNANFGILPPIENIRDKQIRKKAYSQRALLSLRNTIQNTNILK